MEPNISPERERRKTPILSSLREPVSPPRRRVSPRKCADDKRELSASTRRPSSTTKDPENAHPPTQSPTSTFRKDSNPKEESPPNLALIESGQQIVTNHLAIFSSRLRECTRPPIPQVPRLSISSWIDLYKRNDRPDGNHFVIHQHDHPIAGPHYDLRLQFSDSSSVSWSIMYGLPGNPNSQRLNRNAVETRVHCFWNHLIETASPVTGSMLIWDTGEYEVLPYQIEVKGPETESEGSELGASDHELDAEMKSENEKLKESFHNRKIRLRLHGTRLPKNYTITLRLDKASGFSKPVHLPQKRKRRRLQSTRAVNSRRQSTSSPSLSPPPANSYETQPKDQHTDPEDSSETNAPASSDTETDHQIRINNAYPGSTNTIGSIHQRRWFITLDRENSGFVPENSTGSGKKTWVRKREPRTGELMGFEPFYVHGPDVERSVVTGRLGREVFEDEGVEDFVRRRGWRAVLN